MQSSITIIKPGCYELSAEDYHADPAPVPSASASLSKKLLGETPRHAYLAHPRLNPEQERESKEAFNLGTAAHAMVLRQPDEFAVIDAKDWKTDKAKAQKAAAEQAGQVPLLRHQYDRTCEMTNSLFRQLDVHEDDYEAFREGYGHPEQTIIWQDIGGIWCRSRLDWMHRTAPNKYGILYDYKTTGQSADPNEWGRRTMWTTGCDIQAAFNIRGMEKLYGYTPEFRFVVQETSPPYAMCVVGVSDRMLEIGRQKVDRALRMWAWCLKNDCWPGYPAKTVYPEVPSFQQNKLDELADTDQFIREAGYNHTLEFFNDWSEAQVG